MGKDKEIIPRRQEMKVKVKPPRIYRDTMMKAFAYYKSFGGQFFNTGVIAKVKFVKEPNSYIRNVKGALGPEEDRPCPKRFKRKNSNVCESSIKSTTMDKKVHEKVIIPKKEIKRKLDPANE